MYDEYEDYELYAHKRSTVGGAYRRVGAAVKAGENRARTRGRRSGHHRGRGQRDQTDEREDIARKLCRVRHIPACGYGVSTYRDDSS